MAPFYCAVLLSSHLCCNAFPILLSCPIDTIGLSFFSAVANSISNQTEVFKPFNGKWERKKKVSSWKDKIALSVAAGISKPVVFDLYAGYS